MHTLHNSLNSPTKHPTKPHPRRTTQLFVLIVFLLHLTDELLDGLLVLAVVGLLVRAAGLVLQLLAVHLVRRVAHALHRLVVYVQAERNTPVGERKMECMNGKFSGWYVQYRPAYTPTGENED